MPINTTINEQQLQDALDLAYFEGLQNTELFFEGTEILASIPAPEDSADLDAGCL